MKYTVRTPGPNNYGDERFHAVIRVTATNYRSVCGHRVRAWRKVKNGAVTCAKCIKVLKGLKVA